MQHDNLRIEIGGAEIDDLYRDLVCLEVELDEELAGMFRMTVALRLNADGSWTYLDDDRFVIWQRVVITAGLADDSRQLLTGFITHLRPQFTTGLEQSRLDIWGMDASVLMDRVDKLKDWPNKKDSDIAAETFRAYGLTPQVTDTDVIHDEEVSTIIQRETDMQLLRRLALRNGYECFVDGDTGYFRPPGLGRHPATGAGRAVRRGDQRQPVQPRGQRAGTGRRRHVRCRPRHRRRAGRERGVHRGDRPGREPGGQLPRRRHGPRTRPHRTDGDHRHCRR